MGKKWIIAISYLYVLLPIGIFFIGWVKWWISVPACLLMCYFFREAILADFDLYLPEWNRGNITRGIIILLLISVWVYFSGIGNLVWQNADHPTRNAFYEILVSNEWPVIKNVTYKDGNQIRGLIYYIGYWLPAAIIGKLFGLTAGYVFQYIWAICGIFIGIVIVNSFLKKWSIWPVILFITFSGLDTVGYALNAEWNFIMSFGCMEWWAGYPIFQFSSFTTQLYWVYNQAIHAWVLLALIMLQKNNRQIICIWSLGLLSCTFPFVGMTPFVAYVIFRNARAGSVGIPGGRMKAVKELFSIENILGGGVIGIISAIYLAGNVSVQESAVPVISAVNMEPQAEVGEAAYDLTKWALFILLEVGVYYFYIYRYYKKSALLYISLIFLLACPFIKIGTGGDFCMRASIPSLLILYYMVIQCIRKDLEGKRWICFCGILITLGIGAITAIHEMGRSISNTKIQYREQGRIINPVNTEEMMLQGGNFSGQIDGNPFFEYFAK